MTVPDFQSLVDAREFINKASEPEGITRLEPFSVAQAAHLQRVMEEADRAGEVA